MEEQSHTFVLNTEVIDSAIHIEKEKKMAIVEKESQLVWKDNKTGKLQQGKECPFTSGVLVASIGDEIPKGITKKAAKKPQTKAVKPEGNK
jgi:hypothetical protein